MFVLRFRSLQCCKVIPHSGFKRYQLDKLAFARNPEPRVLTYEERRDLDHEPGHTDVRKRLRGANSEVRIRIVGKLL